MENKTIMITGGAGFIGSNLADKLLLLGNNVVVIDNINDYYDPEIKISNIKSNMNNPHYFFKKGDIRNLNDLEEIFSKYSIDIVVHLAACAGVRPSIDDPVMYNEVNCGGTLNILEMMKKHKVFKLVAASSSSVYGNCKTVPFKETDQVDFAISPYAATKKANEIMGHVYYELFDFSIAFLRFFTVYGPRQRPDLAINKFTRLIMNDEVIPLFGDGTTSRDYTYIDDIVDGIIKAINWVLDNYKVYEIFNLGESTPITLIEMVNTIEKVLNKKAQINYLPMQQGDVEKTFADISKAKKVLKYNPQTSFEDGIKKFVEWYKEK